MCSNYGAQIRDLQSASWKKNGSYGSSF